MVRNGNSDDEYHGQHRRPDHQRPAGTHLGSRLRAWTRPEPRDIGQPSAYTPRHAAAEEEE